MRFLLSLVVTITLGLASQTPAHAQSETVTLFNSYEELRSTLDDLMSTREIAELLTTFGGAGAMTSQDMMSLEIQTRNVFPVDFENSALMLRQEMGNGFAQDLIAYWTETSYVYAHVLWHERPDGTVIALRTGFHSNPEVLLEAF